MISMNWVKDYIDLDGENLKELAEKITKAGVNIEGVYSKHIDNLVIGEVLECIDHPNSDHLHICKVDVGKEVPIQIVCGAQNVRKGIKVIVSLPGAVLPGNIKIEAGSIRGVESNGMICALFELGFEEKTEENYAKGIAELPLDAKVGMDACAYLGNDDTLYDVDIHKHRNNDCYYHIGFAYEVGTILNKKVKLPESKYNEIQDNVNNYITLKVETEKCPYYLGRMVKNVVIKESPEWIKKRLISAGMRPINNVVDISNFVMLEFGQPTHFFDADKLGNTVLVRDAKDNEKIVTLDGNERTLNKNDIVITNGSIPTCIAGVMGGENTEVDENTKNIFIEAAIFDSVSIRNTAQRLNLKSEASTRYGKGLNYEYTIMAMDRCLSLLEEYASGEICSGTILHDKVDKTIKEVEFTIEDINNLLGINISLDDMKVELQRLDFEYTLDKDKFKVIIPRRRLDIDPNIADMAEEIGRLYGYHNLISSLPNVETKRGVYVGDVKIRKEISKRLRCLGLNEAKTYTLVSPDMASAFKYEDFKNIVLPNPMSVDKSVVRTTIVPSLLQVYDYNKARKVNNINIYEISKTYHDEYIEDTKISILMKGNYIENNWNHTIIKSDFYTLKGIIENLLNYLGLKNRYSFTVSEVSSLHPGMQANIIVDREIIGVIGRIHPSIRKDEIYVAELSMTKLNKLNIKPIKYKEANKYPEIKKDVAFIVDNSVSSSEIETEIKRSAGRLLKEVLVFDIYRGENIEDNKKSIAYNLVFEDNTRTLTEEEVMEKFNNVIISVEKKFNASVRDK